MLMLKKPKTKPRQSLGGRGVGGRTKEMKLEEMRLFL